MPKHPWYPECDIKYYSSPQDTWLFGRMADATFSTGNAPRTPCWDWKVRKLLRLHGFTCSQDVGASMRGLHDRRGNSLTTEKHLTQTYHTRETQWVHYKNNRGGYLAHWGAYCRRQANQQTDKTENHRCRRGCGEIGTLALCWQECEMVQPLCAGEEGGSSKIKNSYDMI